jgi:hypothetical protein
MIIEEIMKNLTITVPILGAVYIFYQILKSDMKQYRDDMNKIEANHREDMKEVRERNERTDALWADLLKQIHDIKLFQVTKDQPKS